MDENAHEEADLTIDFPQEGEVITSSHYTIRISATEASDVEVSINEGPWQACRESAGYWWFDWSSYESGPHEIMARGVDREGDLIEADCEIRVDQ